MFGAVSLLVKHRTSNLMEVVLVCCVIEQSTLFALFQSSHLN